MWENCSWIPKPRKPYLFVAVVMCALFLASLFFAPATGARAVGKTVPRLPQMGYNTWYDYTSSITEENMRDAVDAMVEMGFPELGYTYFNLDDDWADGRYDNGTVYADRSRFPSGTLKPLADYVHSKGLGFGTYTDRGTQTCGGHPGALGSEVIDAQTYAKWGVDYLKEDSCHSANDPSAAVPEYEAMSKALRDTGRPILFSLCGWEPWYAPITGRGGKYNITADSWRIGPDTTNWQHILTNIDINSKLSAYAGPDKGWNDPCLLRAEDSQGKTVTTAMQTRFQFSMWAVMAAPLLISANFRKLSAENIETFTNPEVIAVDQDPLGVQGIRILGGDLAGGNGTANIWSRKLSGGSFAVAFANSGISPVANLTCDAQCAASMIANRPLDPTASPNADFCFRIRDLWSREDLEAEFTQVNPLAVPEIAAGGGIRLFKLTPCQGGQQ